jgi:hypothetical protein
MTDGINMAEGRVIRGGAERLAEIDRLLSAIGRIRHYVAMRDEQPLSQTTDTIHAIHTGTRWEAELLLSDLRSVLEILP